MPSACSSRCLTSSTEPSPFTRPQQPLTLVVRHVGRVFSRYFVKLVRQHGLRVVRAMNQPCMISTGAGRTSGDRCCPVAGSVRRPVSPLQNRGIVDIGGDDAVDRRPAARVRRPGIPPERTVLG